MARPIFSSIRRSGRFSSRLMVDCEKVAPARQPIERHLEYRVGAQGVGVDAVLVARRDHQHPKVHHVRDAVHGAGRIARIVDAGRQPPRHIEPPLHLPQRQEPGVQQRPAVEPCGHGLATHG